MTPEEAIAIVKSKSKGRTRYEGQEPFLDEVLVDHIDRLAADLAKAKATLIELVHDCCLPLPHERCVFRPGGTNGWSACCAARRTISEIAQ